MFAADLMIDDKLNIWFVEVNTNPQLIPSTEEKHIMYLSMLRGLFEIQYAYFRSRMKRYLILLKEMYRSPGNTRMEKLDYWKKRYQDASLNRLEPEFQISPNNSWVPFIDMNRKGSDAFYGLLPEGCL